MLVITTQSYRCGGLTPQAESMPSLLTGVGGDPMRRAALLAVLMLALPIAAFAKSSLVFTNTGGGVQLKSGTLLGTAQFTAFTGSGGTITGNLGQVAYQTGSLRGRTLTASVDTYSFAAG